MGKGMKAGKQKKNPNKINITARQLQVAQKATEKDYEERIERAKYEAEHEATKLMKSLMYLALRRAFDFKLSDIDKLNNAIEDVSNQFGENYGWQELYQELADFGVGVEGVVYDDDGKVVDW